MLCVVIKGPTFQEAHQQIAKALDNADLVELRLDCFHSLYLDALKALRSHFSIPMIFTLRSHRHGGSYTQSEENRQATLRALIPLKPEYLDLENHLPKSFLKEMATHTKLILSYHNFAEMPENLEEIYQEMRKVPACFYKIAVTAKSSVDALHLTHWAKKADDKLVAISMGPHGQVNRILSPTVSCPISYVALEEGQESAPGQLSVSTLTSRYHHRALNPHTALYGLIGDPIEQSISDVTHTSLIREMGIDAVYVKMQVTPTDLPNFLQVVKQLPFHGLSVTMPLKEKIIPYLDQIDPQAAEIGAVNTLLFENGKITGFNTDGMGALNALEKECPVKGKRIILIGAGGAAKAITHEAIRRGGLVTVINRDPKKALQRIEVKGLDYMARCAETGYDILINCTPSAMPIDPNHILPKSMVMDITTKPKETEFLKVAKQKDCQIIYGYQMFIEQALGQFHLWFKNSFDINECRAIFEKKVKDCCSDN